jgi:hypothetical protein
MGNIDRATLGQEFYDITSDQLLLAPEPQYLHGLLFKGAMEASMTMGSGMGLPIPGRDIATSGPGYANLLDARLTLSDPLLSPAIKFINQLGKPNIGHTIRINRPKYTDSTYTRASRASPVGTTFSKTPMNVESEQAKITIERFAGPYDSTSGEVRPYGVEAFDASRSVHDMEAIRNHHFQRDFDKWLDTVGVTLFDSGAVIYPTGMTADNDSTTVGDYPFSVDQIFRTRTSLVTASIPPFADGRYIMILTPLQVEQLHNDPQYGRLARYDPKFNPLYLSNHVATISKFHIFESQTLRTVANSSSVPIQYGQAFGREAVGAGSQGMPRVVPSTDDNYGETSIAIWLWYSGFEILDNRFMRSLRSS